LLINKCFVESPGRDIPAVQKVLEETYRRCRKSWKRHTGGAETDYCENGVSIYIGRGNIFCKAFVENVYSSGFREIRSFDRLMTILN
jgi:hypothetical protein